MATSKKTTRLKAILQSPTLVPFGVLPLHAQMAEKAGFEAFEISGGMTCWWTMGMPDVGLMTQTEVVAHAKKVADSVDIPVYCDADTGYGGGPANVRRTSGMMTGIELVSDEEAIGRLQAACDARDELDPDFVIVARTDGYGAAGGSVDEAIRRARLYREKTNVDVTFFEGLHTWEQVRRVLAETPRPAYVLPHPAIGPRPSIDELSAMGQSMDIVPFLLPGVQEVWNLLLAVKECGSLAPMDDYLKKMASHSGTPQEVGWGHGFAKPAISQVRNMEDKYMPPEQRPDYENTPNAAKQLLE
ncbi:Pyruvate/Phosphoenolpyruvate kinase-like domain-containing protein [Aspergillus granulosus]|uniref:Pyruvate/Phosphoenolpyruvate kinase-like domain-containing protein n=1 Tax=Aspergillus granulosus TaxID=176169 RepID=A0ABR4GTI2_9EURO